MNQNYKRTHFPRNRILEALSLLNFRAMATKRNAILELLIVVMITF